MRLVGRIFQRALVSRIFNLVMQDGVAARVKVQSQIAVVIIQQKTLIVFVLVFMWEGGDTNPQTPLSTGVIIYSLLYGIYFKSLSKKSDRLILTLIQFLSDKFFVKIM